jgi:hypothetical protein
VLPKLQAEVLKVVREKHNFMPKVVREKHNFMPIVVEAHCGNRIKIMDEINDKTANEMHNSNHRTASNQ